MTRHVNIPVFIPHLGCPNMCVFCNQRTISGVKEFDVSSARTTIEENLSSLTPDDEVEIAFFGGSFTGIDRDLMISLLDLTYGYVKTDRVKSIRCSTRPDYIDCEILDLLKKYGVKTIELGLQSVDERVLELTKRGHGFAEEKRACELIIEYGFELVGQMMIGLPFSTPETELATADFIIQNGACAARIYPTVVFHDTELCSMAKCGEYTPLLLDEAIERSAAVLEKFIDADVNVIRIGLCSSDNLLSDETYFAGPNHPALGELVESELYYKRIIKKLSEAQIPEKADVYIFVSPGALSKAIGQKRKNKIRLLGDPRFRRVFFAERDDVKLYETVIQTKTEIKNVFKIFRASWL